MGVSEQMSVLAMVYHDGALQGVVTAGVQPWNFSFINDHEYPTPTSLLLGRRGFRLGSLVFFQTDLHFISPFLSWAAPQHATVLAQCLMNTMGCL